MKISNSWEDLSVCDFLKWELEGAKKSWECNVVGEQEPWDSLTTDDLLDQIAQQIETDYKLDILSIVKE